MSVIATADSKETILEFIEDYKARRFLWDNNHVCYANHGMRRGAIQELADKYNVTTNAVKNKIKNLRSYFCKEQQKVISGAQPTWFAYKALSFLWEVSILATREVRESIASESGTVPTIKIELVDEKDDDSEDQTEKENEDQPDTEFLVLHENISNKRKHDDEQEEQTDPIEVKTDNKRKCINRPEEMVSPDEYSIFGEYITKKIRKLNAKNKIIAQNRISNILLQLEMDEIVETSTSGVEWTTL